MGELTHISLFSGAVDGIGIAAEMAGFETIIQCEIDSFCQSVLRKNNPDAVLQSDITKIDKLPWSNLLSAGVPCQQHSNVNKKKTGDNFEWHQTIRLIRASYPNWVIIENVNGILNTIHEEICTDLETEGYEVETFNIPSVAVGAPHERYRIFIVANSSRKPVAQTNKILGAKRKKRNPWENDMRNTWGSLPETYWGVYQPPICGVDDGLTKRFYKDRMKALGNAVVPWQVLPILEAIYEIETHLIRW